MCLIIHIKPLLLHRILYELLHPTSIIERTEYIKISAGFFLDYKLPIH
ncbi:hypothetical protein J582_4100 [Acinetobacter sp. 1566109]|nr:hypothetical protein J582_4100 [Acinetobacter sp. 1566109]